MERSAKGLFCASIFLALHLTLAINTTSTTPAVAIIITAENYALLCKGSNETHREICCSYEFQQYKATWYLGGRYLTDYLTTLKERKCPEFKAECEKPIYDFTPFTRLVYDNFCNRLALFGKCTQILHDIAKKYNFPAPKANYRKNYALHISENSWRNLTSSLNPSVMTRKDLNRPCVQIALFDRPTGGIGRFHEVVQPFTLFCDFAWVGYDIDTALNRGVSAWLSWGITCRANTVICMVVVACLAIAIVVANSIVISVYATTPKLRNSQSVFKTSIAVGDLISGLFVVPNVIILQYYFWVKPHVMGDIMPGNYTDGLERRYPAGQLDSIVSEPYIRVLGFFTTLSLSLSNYTLLIASFDRFWAIFRPLKYNKARAKRYAKISCVIVWIFAIIVASIPYMVPSLYYKPIISSMVTAMGTEAIILMAIAFVIPLVTLCAVNIGTFRSAKSHARVRRRLKSFNNASGTREQSMEKRLSKILGLMVGVFSACIFPMFLLIVLVFFFDNLYFIYPEKLDPHASMVYSSVEFCTLLLFLSNSFWNCLIYSSRGRDFRTAAKTLKVIKVSNSVVNVVFHSMRRLSEVPINYYRRKSSAGSDVTTSTSDPSRTTRLASMDSTNLSDGATSAASTQTHRSRKPSDSSVPKVYYSTVMKKEKNATKTQDDDKLDDSTFGSFAIDAGADRLYLSVMENIPEDKE